MKPLADMLAEHLPNEDADTRRLVGALAGLLAAIADADGVYDPSEEVTIRQELRRVHVLSDGGVEAVLALLRTHLRALSQDDLGHAGIVRELLDRDGRIEVLDTLLEVAAADGVITTSETNLLRRLSTALGLTQDDYTALQSKHRDKLAVFQAS
jgi:uncharacterized tellurite resistance protein B-like protein